MPRLLLFFLQFAVLASAWVATPQECFRPLLSSSSSSDDPSITNGSKLQDCVCLVTGASRGIGKGVALELGRQGAIVYITGTTTSETETEPGTIQDTAAEVTAAGGRGIPVKCDHGNDDDVQKLMDQIDNEHGRLDILINNAFRLPSEGIEFLNKKFWEQGAAGWDPIHTVGLRSHYIASCYAIPLMFKSRTQRPTNLPRPLIAMIGSFGGLTYTFNVAYGVGKAGVDRLAKDMAIELQEEDVCVVSLWPGVVETERTKLSVANGDWDKYVNVPLDNAETPQFTGKAVVALATDPDNMSKTGSYQVVAELADEYDFYDVNGVRPPSIRSLRFLLPSYAFDDATRDKIPASMIPDWKLPFWVMAQGRPPN